MANAIQYTGQWAIDQLTKLKDEAHKRAAEISTLNGQLIAENTRADQIADPAKRSSVKAAIAKLVQRQVQTVKVYRDFWGRTQKLSNDVIAWLRSNGMSTQGLAGPEVLPAAVILGLVAGGALWVANNWLTGSLSVTRTRAATVKSATDRYLAGQLTSSQYDQIVSAAERQADANGPGGDPFGFSNIAKALTPIAIVVGLIIVGPPLLRAFSAGRERRAA